MTTAHIALGSNVGDRISHLSLAVGALSEIPETHVDRASHMYESEPAYVTDQDAFLNAVAVVETELTSDALLSHLLRIEDEMGRVREIDKGPRIIDLDLLLYGDEERVSDELSLPHPGLAERDFVVTPLLEVSPRLHLPDGSRLSRSSATVGPVVRDMGPIPDPGEATNEPVFADAWAVVAEGARDQDVMAGWDSGLIFKREALEEEGIPHAFDPYEPDANMDPFGMPTTFKLMVPQRYAERARELLRALDAAEPIYPEGLGVE